ncbi:MAG: hypothetical protein LBE09_00025, partial [Christensenellaceae bacterium]|nr:hypothetical protein [Christensenellaceae bacterium]
MKKIIFFDLETKPKEKQKFGNIIKFGAINDSNEYICTSDKCIFTLFIKNAKFLCGHNILKHDKKYILHYMPEYDLSKIEQIDTLYLWPLVSPARMYYKLIKTYKSDAQTKNNPHLDSKLARELFDKIVDAFIELNQSLKDIFHALLHEQYNFKSFFLHPAIKYSIKFSETIDCEKTIKSYFKDIICESADIKKLISDTPVELAYSLAIINATDKYIFVPSWVTINHSGVHDVISSLRNKHCDSERECLYCKNKFVALKELKRLFAYTQFKEYDGKPLQEDAINATMNGKSILAIFQPSDDNSITFQLPALIQAETTNKLTVVISPSLSLIQHQIDRLEGYDITAAVALYPSLNYNDQINVIDRIKNGNASIVYLAEESFCNKSNILFEKELLLLNRKIGRFVIDDVCRLTSLDRDPQVDYSNITNFIKKYKEKRGLKYIPVSCFTTTARPDVVGDITAYFEKELDLELEKFISTAQRKKFKYQVHKVDSNEIKFAELLKLLQRPELIPAIVYVATTKTAKNLTEALNTNNIHAVNYHEQESKLHKSNHAEFMNRS